MELFLCSECGDLSTDGRECVRCGAVIDADARLDPGAAVGFIGFPGTGKTCYLAALHDQLMHAAPQWRVEVSERAFEQLTEDFWKMCEGGIPRKTELESYSSAGFFKITVHYGGRAIPLVMNDLAGEWTSRMGTPTEDDGAVEEIDEDLPPRPEEMYFQYLSQCRSLLIAIPCWEIRAALTGENHPSLNWRDARVVVRESDQSLARLFRRLLKVPNELKHLEAILVGADVYGRDHETATQRAVEDFQRVFRVFPGVLKNDGVSVGATAVSNIGFNNEVEVGKKDGLLAILSVPEPFNVIEPLRRVLPLFGVEDGVSTTSDGAQSPTEETPSAASPLSRDEQRVLRRAFISYRRDGGADAARLIRSALEPAGWRAFLDVDDLGACFFDDRLLLEIKRAEAVILIISPGSLERCAQPDDWVRREIAYALKRGKRIVPVVKDGFRFSADLNLPEEIEAIRRCNSVEYSHGYYQATIERVLAFLNGEEPDAAASPPRSTGTGAAEEAYVRWRCACGKSLRTPRRNAGRNGACPACGARHRVPLAGASR